MTRKTIVLGNTKGGSCKTTSIIQIARGLSETKRVLLIDTDPQGDLTNSYPIDVTKESSFMSAVMGDESIKPVNTGIENLDLLTATEDLKLLETSNDQMLLVNFKSAVNRYKADYDVVLIDTAGFDGNRLYYSLVAADWLLIPMEMETFNRNALSALIKKFKTVKEHFNKELSLMGLIPSRINGIRLGMPHRAEERELWLWSKKQLGNHVWPCVEFKKAVRVSQKAQSNVFDHKPTDTKCVAQFREIVKLVNEKLEAQ